MENHNLLWQQKYSKVPSSSDEYNKIFDIVHGYYVMLKVKANDKFFVCNLLKYMADEGYMIMNCNVDIKNSTEKLIRKLHSNNDSIFKNISPNIKEFIYAATGIQG